MTLLVFVLTMLALGFVTEELEPWLRSRRLRREAAAAVHAQRFAALSEALAREWPRVASDYVFHPRPRGTCTRD